MQLRLDDRFLMEIAGFPVFREGRALYQAGKVLEATRTPLTGATPLPGASPQLLAEGGETLSGLVQGGGSTPFRTGLEVKSRTNVRNLCTCREARARGIICAHAIAVALRIAAGQGSAAQEPTAKKAAVAAASEIAPFPRERFHSLAEGADSLPELQLALILAPRFEEAFSRGAIPLTLEAILAGKPARLEALGRGKEQLRAAPEILDLLHNLWQLLQGELADHLQLKPDQFLELLAHLTPSTPVTLGRGAALHISTEPFVPSLRVARRPDGGWRISVPDPGGIWLTGGRSAWLYQESNRTLQPVSPGLPGSYLPVLRAPIDLTQEQGIRFLAVELEKLRPWFEIDVADDTAGAAHYTIAAAQPRVELALEGSLNYVEARLRFRYPDRTVEARPAEGEIAIFSLVDPADPQRLLLRNTALELEAQRELVAAGFEFKEREGGHWGLNGQPAVLQFYAGTLPAWQARAEWKVEIGARFGRVTERVEVLRPEVELRGSGENWFELAYDLRGSGGTVIPRDQVERMLRVGQGFTQTPGGKIAVFDQALVEDFREVLSECDPRQTGEGFRLNKNQAGFVGATLARRGLEPTLPPAKQSGAWLDFLRGRAAAGQEELRPVPLGALEEVLRPYQKQGVYWLHFLAANGLGGVLADDMGLGKTLQALTFINLRRREAKPSGPALVVCPTSLTANWRREAERFVPDLQVLVLEGSPEERAALLPRVASADLVVTSYALLRRDIEDLRAREFDVVFLDEGQQIKNPESQVAQAAGALHSKLRFVLTGTPVENRVRDLWSLFQFAMPGYLGSRQVFKERYETLVEGGGAAARAARDRLGRRIRPYLLRRRKEDVLKELPEKIQQVLYCDMAGPQAAIYQELLTQGRRRIDEASGEKNANRQRMLMLTTLLRLRQACCDPRLLPGQEPDGAAGAKLAALLELVEESVEGGHRVLIFSQFSTMLGLVARALEERETAFCYLDGQTQERDAVIQRFQAADGPPVFLLSLKAGGVGLNLSAADTVVLFDPWWNPAVEAQAADRAHRMGQTRVVNVYRLVARGTVEEKILALQDKKRELVNALVESDEPLMQGLSLEEMRGLLE